MMKIKLMKDSAMQTLYNNATKVFGIIKNNPESSIWLRDFLGEEPYEATEYEVKDFTLIDPDSVKNYDDVKYLNGIKLYENLYNQLPSHILCDLHFWAWINFDIAYKQGQKSILLDKPDIIKKYWVNTQQNRRNLMHGVMARELIKVKISVDNRLDDRYELTKYLFSNLSLYDNFVMRNISDLRNVTLPILRIEKEVYDATHKSISKLDSSALLKEASKIGSARLIDIMSEEEIEKELRIVAPKTFASYY